MKKNVMIAVTWVFHSNKGILCQHSYKIVGTEKYDDIYIIYLENPYGFNRLDLIQNSQLNLSNGMVYKAEEHNNIEKKIIQYNIDNVNNGRLKIDIRSFSKLFTKIYICDFYSNSSYYDYFKSKLGY